MLLTAEVTFDVFLVIWVVVIIATVIGELLTADLTMIWFTGGGIAALILSLCGVSNPYIQIAVFIVVSILLLFTIGQWARKKINGDAVKTNIDAAIGKEILVLKDADSFNSGEGKYLGIVWTILTYGEEKVQKGDIVYIKAVEGNKLFVTKNKEEQA